MLSTLRHAAHCRALRAAKADEAIRLAKEEAEDEDADESAKTCKPPADNTRQQRH
jgi:hypothetical protein